MIKDFTIARYREILSIAKKRYRFITFCEANLDGNVALWRHDVDFSPQRALAVALLEAEAEVVATYFFQISSRFYNVFEPEISSIVREIVALGHEVGLHFDSESAKEDLQAGHERRLKFQASVLETIAEKNIGTFSLHNPTTMVGIVFDEQQHCGLINASHSGLRENFSYCSDSNGIWRFRSLDSIVDDTQVKKLYVLTHPEWWQAVAMAPRERIQRCIEGRAISNLKYYDGLLSANNRPNIRVAV
jgi:hypothetical protein